MSQYSHSLLEKYGNALNTGLKGNNRSKCVTVCFLENKQTHTHARTHTNLKSGLMTTNPYSNKKDTNDICCDNIHNTFNREQLTLN